jgi:hypothetical protein
MRGEDRGPVGMSSRDIQTTKAQREMKDVVPIFRSQLVDSGKSDLRDLPQIRAKG